MYSFSINLKKQTSDTKHIGWCCAFYFWMNLSFNNFAFSWRKFLIPYIRRPKSSSHLWHCVCVPVSGAAQRVHVPLLRLFSSSLCPHAFLEAFFFSSWYHGQQFCCQFCKAALWTIPIKSIKNRLTCLNINLLIASSIACCNMFIIACGTAGTWNPILKRFFLTDAHRVY